jgi:hypothetical protein
MTRTIVLRRRLPWLWLALTAFLLLPPLAFPQTTLTGAIQFSTNSSGAASGGQVWNTLGGDSYYDLWLAINPDATSPVNGPSDAQAGIAIPLQAGNSYKFYIFGQPGCCSTGVNALNLFFDGNNSTPGISAFGAVNTSSFLPNSSSTLTLQAGSVAGSRSTTYSSGGVIVVLSGYGWYTPATPPGDVCQAMVFSPGGGPDYYGSFTLQVWPEAALSLGQGSGAPESKLTITGSGFAPTETVNIYVNRIAAPRLFTTTTDASGSFSLTAREPQHPYGPMELYAVGLSSGKLGTAALFVTPSVIMNPGTGAPGGTAAAYVFGFGAGEAVDVYWNNPRQLLGTATANAEGSSALTITIPADASPGINAVIGVGQTTKAIGLGEVRVQ